MGIEAKKDRPKAKPKPKVAMVVKKAETQNQHDAQIKLKQKKLDDKAVRKKDAVRKVGGSSEDVATIRKAHTRQKLRLKTAVAVRLEARGESGFMLKAGVRLKLGKIFKAKLEQGVGLSGEPGKKSAQLYKIKLEANVLGAVLGLEKYQQKDKNKMYFGYTVARGSLKITFLGQFAKTPDKTEMSARIKVSKRLSSKVKLFADITLDNPNKPGSLKLSDVEGVVGLSLPNSQTIAFYTNPGDKRFVLTYMGRF